MEDLSAALMRPNSASAPAPMPNVEMSVSTLLASGVDMMVSQCCSQLQKSQLRSPFLSLCWPARWLVSERQGMRSGIKATYLASENKHFVRAILDEFFDDGTAKVAFPPATSRTGDIM